MVSSRCHVVATCNDRHIAPVFTSGSPRPLRLPLSCLPVRLNLRQGEWWRSGQKLQSTALSQAIVSRRLQRSWARNSRSDPPERFVAFALDIRPRDADVAQQVVAEGVWVPARAYKPRRLGINGSTDRPGES